MMKFFKSNFLTREILQIFFVTSPHSSAYFWICLYLWIPPAQQGHVPASLHPSPPLNIASRLLFPSHLRHSCQALRLSLSRSAYFRIKLQNLKRGALSKEISKQIFAHSLSFSFLPSIPHPALFLTPTPFNPYILRECVYYPGIDTLEGSRLL